MNRVSKFRVAFLLFVLSLSGLVVLLREHRPSFLRPDLHSMAYATTASGNLAVIDLVKNSTVARVSVGPDASELRAHPTQNEIWGVSPTGGYVWVLNAENNQLAAKITTNGAPYSLDFSPDGKFAYTTSASSGSLLAINSASKQIAARAATGAQPILARLTPDAKTN